MLAVMKQKSAVSIGSIHYFVRHFFLKALTLVLTLMNKGPSKPPMTPKMIAAGIV